ALLIILGSVSHLLAQSSSGTSTAPSTDPTPSQTATSAGQSADPAAAQTDAPAAPSPDHNAVPSDANAPTGTAGAQPAAPQPAPRPAAQTPGVRAGSVNLT